MPDLFSTPVLVIEGSSSLPDFQVTDPQGTVLARATQVVGPQPKNAIQRFLKSGDTSRVVLQVSSPDGTPLFFADRPAYRPSAIRPPCAIVAPDGSLIGRVEHDAAELGRSFLAGGGTGAVTAFKLLDASGHPLGRADFEAVSMRQGIDHRPIAVGGRYCVYRDMNGVEIAHMDADRRSTLQLPYSLPDPLRLLVIASPLAFALMVEAD